MTEAQIETLATLTGWEVQNDSNCYAEVGYILPDGRAFDASSGAAVEVATYPVGTVMIGRPT